MRIALYEPDIPQNTGTILRLCACLGVEAHIIEPAGFPVTDRAFRRAGMDYLDQVALTRHGSFAGLRGLAAAPSGLRWCCSPPPPSAPTSTMPSGDDQVLLFGRESAGVPEAVHAAADARLRIPMRRRPALAQRGDGGGAGGRRGAAADGRALPQLSPSLTSMPPPMPDAATARSTARPARAPGSRRCATTSARRSRRSRTRCRRARRSRTSPPAASCARPGAAPTIAASRAAAA